MEGHGIHTAMTNQLIRYCHLKRFKNSSSFLEGLKSINLRSDLAVLYLDLEGNYADGYNRIRNDYCRDNLRQKELMSTLAAQLDDSEERKRRV